MEIARFDETLGSSMTAKTILLVNNQAYLRGILAEQLEINGAFTVFQQGSGAEALISMRQNSYDLALLDASGRNEDAKKIFKMLRSKGLKRPVIVLGDSETASNQNFVTDCENHYLIIKPFRLSVLLARIRTLLRQYERSGDADFLIGPYAFSFSKRLLTHDNGNEKVKLTEKEAAILQYLLAAGDNPVSRDVLLNEIWGYRPDITTHTLETYIYRLRQKIEYNPSDANILVTEPGGYKLVL